MNRKERSEMSLLITIASFWPKSMHCVVMGATGEQYCVHRGMHLMMASVSAEACNGSVSRRLHCHYRGSRQALESSVH
jgi:hypothetical protein